MNLLDYIRLIATAKRNFVDHLILERSQKGIAEPEMQGMRTAYQQIIDEISRVENLIMPQRPPSAPPPP